MFKTWRGHGFTVHRKLEVRRNNYLSVLELYDTENPFVKHTKINNHLLMLSEILTFWCFFFNFSLNTSHGVCFSSSSNESISYSVCESITSPLPQSYQLVQHTSSVNHIKLQNTVSVNKELVNSNNNNNSSDKLFDINSNHGLIELIYDSILKCYYDPKSGRFYELI